MKYIKLIFLLLINYSCSCQTSINLAIRNCVEIETDDIIKSIYGENIEIGLYEIVSIVEKEFKSEGFINIPLQEQYLVLLDSIYSNYGRKLYENEIIREYSSISGLLITPVVLGCPYKVVSNEKKNLKSSVTNLLEIAPSLQSSGYNKKSVLEYLNCITKEDFRHIEYRAPIIVIFLFHLDGEYR